MSILDFLALLAASQVTLASDVFLERIQHDANGRSNIVLEQPRAIARGDRLLFVLSYRNVGTEPAQDFVVTNPVPDSVIYAGADEAEPEVSVDWGRNWGALSSLSVKEPAGHSRAARPEDVTHVRWSIRRPIGAGESGRLTYHAVAR
jgi:uncharacterized repeat protein (TIGR01451 family)